MTFLETFTVPFGVSIFANHTTEKVKEVMQRINGNDKILQKLFVDSMIDVLNNTNKALPTNGLFTQLVNAIKHDDTKLFAIIEITCEDRQDNFLNIIKNDKNGNFIKEVFSAYGIDISNIEDDSIYQHVLKNLMQNYQDSFLNNITQDNAYMLIFKEVLKIDDIHRMLKESSQPKDNKVLTHLPSNNFFIGREDELGKIEAKLREEKSLFLLNGTGGIGKTTLAIEYLNRYEDFYEHLAFVEYSNDIKDSFLTAFKNQYKLKSQTPDERFSELLHMLENLGGRNLLIVDDIKTQENFETIKDLKRNFDLLITSRTGFETPNRLDIEHLPEDKAKELFLKYFETKENIDKLLKYLDYHTLFIKLTAQTLKSSRVLTIQKLEEKFANGEFGNITNNLEKSTFNTYLNKLFNLDTLSEREILLLKRLSLFPSVEISFEKLVDFLSVEDEEEFDADLTSLSQLGWLIENGDSFKLHQVIREFLLFSHRISYEESEDIVENFIGKVYYDDNESPIDKFEFIPFAVSISDNINIENEKVATLNNNISLIYQDMGELGKALEYQKKALELTQEVLGDKHPSLATSYNNISMIYQDMGELGKALEYQKKALELKEEVLGDKHPSLATSYNNISTIYKDMGELEKALEYQKKALELQEEVLGDKHPNLASSYNNISTIYQNMGELEKALEYQKKALELTQEVLGDKHPDLAISYANISIIYFLNSNIAEAKEYIDRAENIYRHLFPNGHPNLDSIVRTREYIYKNS